MINYIYGNEAPSVISCSTRLGQRQYTLRVMVEEVNDEMLGTWRWVEVTLPLGKFDYGTIVSHLVRAKYSQDEMEAVLFNQVPEELAEVQAWRALCKEEAHKVLQEISNL